ncbi:LysR family transcriptional regulator [Lactobacillus sp. CBA3605]|uniref:LysR family transcriptional regulator n=1 Tax=Lactobacillus sp. CBA3605 TaxID=2099788 RepID=UPI00269250A5
MLDNYLLQELVIFSTTGTLAKTAEQLHVTQPTVPRGMQKLEADLGVRLFNRQPNRITLTATGQLAATEAATLIQANHDAVHRIQDFDRNQQVLRIKSTLPGPLIVLKALHSQLPTNVTIDQPLLTTAAITTSLRQNQAALVLSNQALTTDELASQLIGS